MRECDPGLHVKFPFPFEGVHRNASYIVIVSDKVWQTIVVVYRSVVYNEGLQIKAPYSMRFV